jgi:hypothetical protein
MHQALKNTISFSLVSGESITVLHGLALTGSNELRPVSPDIVFIPSPDLIVETTVTELTLTNTGGSLLTGTVLVEYWHTIERVFPDAGENLPTRPIVVVSVEGNGEPPIPPFVPASIVIYARPTGDDLTGRGTLAEPYKSFQRAIRDVPYTVPPGVFYAVDCTGLGTEVLPPDFDLPSWKASHISTRDFVDPYFFIQTSVMLRAYPQPAAALTPAQRTIAAGVLSHDPDTQSVAFPLDKPGIITIQAVPDPGWTDNALVGLFAFGAVPKFEFGVIYANTSDTISISTNSAMTFPVQIMEPSATLHGTRTLFGSQNGVVNANHTDSLGIAGFRIVNVGVEPEGPVGMYQQGGLVWYQSCDLPAMGTDTPVRYNGFRGCNLDNVWGIGGETYLQSCRIANCGLGFDWMFRSANQGLSAFSGTVFDNNGTIKVAEGTAVNTNGQYTGGFLTLSNVLVRGAQGDGIYWPGGNAILVDTKIEGSQGNAFVGRGGLLAQLDHVTGAGNTGVGVRSMDGAQIEMTATTTVTGAVDDQQVGNIIAGPYPAVPFNIYDIAGATATGARLFRNS